MTDELTELVAAGRRWVPTTATELPDDLGALDTDELLALLTKVGPEAAQLAEQAKAAHQRRLEVFAELDGRQVSYPVMAKAATNISAVAILRALQRRSGRKAGASPAA